MRLPGADPGDLPPPVEGAGPAQGRAEEILAREEFHRAPPTLLERAWDWVAEQVAALFGVAGGGGSLLAWVVVAVIGVALGAVLVAVVRRLGRDPLARPGVRIDDVGRSAADWRAEAARHEAAGAHRDALRCLWRALLADLAARGLVEEVPGRTTGEYRRRVARSVPDAAGAFGDATALFEVAWYASNDVGPAEVAQERQLGERVLAQARR